MKQHYIPRCYLRRFSDNDKSIYTYDKVHCKSYNANMFSVCYEKDMYTLSDEYVQRCREKNAPPFGIYIHESARTVKGLQGRYYFWHRDEEVSDNADLQKQLKESLLEFLKWEEERHYCFELASAKFAEYEERVQEYFTMIEGWPVK